jgi:vacuolar-type H+-ATPase subunit E/Vma4
MAEDIQGLIEKINQEGVRVAEEKARQIETQALLQAEQIIAKARLEAERLIAEANDKISKMQEKEKALLIQAGRDMLLVLRKEINAMLERLIAHEMRQVLAPESLFKILSSLVQHVCSRDKDEIVVFLNKEDAHKIQESFLSKLKEETKRQIVLRPSENIHAGFVISYDAGKSQFDFSDKALAEYIGTFLKPKLKDILQG